MHQHDEHCGCGAHDHSAANNGHPHEHAEDCGCGEHRHEHGENCGCGHVHVPIPTPEGLTPVQVDFLLALRQRQCLPVACFALTQSDDDARYGVALSPVYLSATSDTMQQVKQLGKELNLLADMELITLDYDMPLKGYPYAEYKDAELYAYFVETVKEAAAKPDATFDTPLLELGSMALTEEGEAMVDQLIS